MLKNIVLDFCKAESWREARDILETHQDVLLTDEADVMMESLMVEADGNVHAYNIISVHHDVLKHARAQGIDAAFADLHDPSPLQRTADAVLAFLNARQPDRKQQLVEEHQALLFSADAAKVFADLIQKYPHKKAELETNQAVLLRCQQIGVAETFREIDRAIRSNMSGNSSPLQ
jgi:hypothetical protein